MKKILVCSLIAFLFFVVSALGSVLIYKSEKTVTRDVGDKYTAIDTVEVGKYKRIRVAVAAVGRSEKAIEIKFDALEGSETVFSEYEQINDSHVSASKVFEIPPEKIRVSTNTAGKYKIFVWTE